ncbi:YggT family protein [Ligilactobacillus cholophilus]|uniref:YggT family protein n=1 Tax=Ligilactobacillus cholophilus TaxID=3050131 RepID=UPI0025AF5A3E|nr:YggT family protein [Ligilactobacillus cholophilus]
MISNIIIGLFNLYTLAIVVYCLMSWFPGALQTKFGYFLARIVNPFLDIFHFIPPIFNIDFSPIIALFALQFVEQGLLFLIRLLFGI